jgi:hypothetical protein
VASVENVTARTVEIFVVRPEGELPWRELEPEATGSLPADRRCNSGAMVARSDSGEEISRIEAGEICKWRCLES